MDNNYSWGLDYISHSWGTKPEQKAAEKKYNHEYYMKHRKLKGQERLQRGTRDPRRYAKDKSIIDTIVDAFKGDTSNRSEIADVPCNVLIYNENHDADQRGRKWRAKMKINTSDGKQVWKYFYTQYQIDLYEELVKTALDVDPTKGESFQEFAASNNINDNGYDKIDDLLLSYDLKEGPESRESDAKKINPNYDPDNPKTSTNCIYCSEAYAMRRLGFDVRAAEKASTDTEASVSTFDFNYGYSTGKTFKGELDVDEKNASDIMEQMDKYPDGSVGILTYRWRSDQSNGHAISWEKIGGKVTFIDTQDVTRPTCNDLSEYHWIDYCRGSSFCCQRLNDTIPKTTFITVKQHVIPISEVYTEPVAEEDYYRGK